MEETCKAKQVGIISRVTVDLVYTGLREMPAPGEELLSPGFALAPGGGAVVSAVLLQRLGIPVKAGLYMGGGLEGELAAGLLRRHGLGPFHPLATPGSQPVVFSSVVSCGGERSIVSYDEPPPPMPEGEMLDFFAGCDIVVLPDAPAPAGQMHRRGQLLLCDPSLPALPRLAGLLPYLDVITPNRLEAERLTGRQAPAEALEWLAGAGVRRPVVKLGRDGCLAWLDGEAVHVPPAEPFALVDTTGAGDNFVAGLLYGLAGGLPFLRCLHLGNVLGALATTTVGAFAPPLDAKALWALTERIYG